MIRCIKHKVHVNGCKICKNIQNKSIPYYKFKDIKMYIEFDSLIKEQNDYINQSKKETDEILDKLFS